MIRDASRGLLGLIVASACSSGEVSRRQDASTGNAATGSDGDGAVVSVESSGSPPDAGGAQDSGSSTTGPGGGDSPACGDGFVEGTEDCDDGNLIDHDSCTNACTQPTCGDAILQNGEDCDDGNSDVSDDCAACVTTYCGDGLLQTGEQCDDGNQAADDDCLASCEDATCGDGVRHAADEACDGADLGRATCATQGFTTGALSCTATCTFDTSGCCPGGVGCP